MAKLTYEQYITGKFTINEAKLLEMALTFARSNSSFVNALDEANQSSMRFLTETVKGQLRSLMVMEIDPPKD